MLLGRPVIVVLQILSTVLVITEIVISVISRLRIRILSISDMFITNMLIKACFLFVIPLIQFAAECRCDYA